MSGRNGPSQCASAECVWSWRFASQPADAFSGRNGRYFLQKALAVVEAGALVKMEVPESARDRLALSYGLSGRSDNLYALADGHPTWALRACDDTETQFNGGFIVAGAQCAPLDVFVEGQSAPIRVTLSFGMGKDGCR